jgi:anti-sigma factor RsiW
MNPELDAKLSALLDGELPPIEAAALRAEIARSPELTARLAELAAVDEDLRALPERALPAELRSRVERAIAAEPRPPRRAPPRSAVAPGSRRRWLAAAAVAAAAAALALVALPRLRRDETPVARTELAPQPERVPPVEIVEAPPVPPEPPAPAPAPEAEPEALPRDLLDPEDEPAAAGVASADDLPVIEVLDVLAELDELEEVGSG